VVNETANEIMLNINRAAHVNAVNLISTVLLTTPKQHMDEKQLATMLELYSPLILDMEYSDNIHVTELSGLEQISRAEDLKRVRRRKHKMGDIIYLDRKHTILLTYYRNNILHLLALPSAIACCFNNANSQTHEQVLAQISPVYPFLRRQLFITWAQEDLPEITAKILDILVSRKLLTVDKKGVFRRPRTSSIESAQLDLLSKVITPILQVYYMTFAILFNTGSMKITRAELIELSHLMAQRVSMIYDLSSPDFFDKRLITNFIDTLKDIDYIYFDKDGPIEYSDESLAVGEDAVSLLDKGVRSSILQLLSADKIRKQ
jgi:glycerol-3-phosphate O-acyltransferase